MGAVVTFFALAVTAGILLYGAENEVTVPHSSVMAWGIGGAAALAAATTIWLTVAAGEEPFFLDARVAAAASGLGCAAIAFAVVVLLMRPGLGRPARIGLVGLNCVAAGLVAVMGVGALLTAEGPAAGVLMLLGGVALQVFANKIGKRDFGVTP